MDDARMRAAFLIAALLLGSTGIAQDPASTTSTVDAPATNQPMPEIVQGPIGSNLAAIARVPNFSSPLAEFLGFASTASSESTSSQYFRSSQRRRLIKTPEMFGDFRRLPTSLALTNGILLTSTLQGSIPQSGGISGLKVAESNQAIPANRAWFSYNHMHDAFQVERRVGGVFDSNQFSVDRFTIGAERTFNEGRWSLEVRLPFAGQIDEGSIQSDSIGDVSLILKRLLVADHEHARSFGIGFELPTGSDGSLFFGGASLTQESDAVYFVPFYSETRQFGSRWFAHYFTQLSVPTTDDDLILRDGGTTTRFSSRAAATTSNDLGLGYWLLPPRYNCDSGLAAIVEGHYTARIGDGDIVNFAGGGNFGSVNQVNSVDNVLNITVGLHAELNGSWSVRVAESFPVFEDQLFDSEAIFQVLRTF